MTTDPGTLIGEHVNRAVTLRVACHGIAEPRPERMR